MNNKYIFICAAVYFCSISFITVAVTVADKHKARKNRQRISEHTLIVLGALGGAAAQYITMKIIRHKTLHKKFMIGLPIIIILQFLLLVCIYCKFIIHI